MINSGIPSNIVLQSSTEDHQKNSVYKSRRMKIKYLRIWTYANVNFELTVVSIVIKPYAERVFLIWVLPINFVKDKLDPLIVQNNG